MSFEQFPDEMTWFQCDTKIIDPELLVHRSLGVALGRVGTSVVVQRPKEGGA